MLRAIARRPAAITQSLIARTGYRIVPVNDERRYSDLETRAREVIRRVSPFTMTTPERIAGLCSAVDYVQTNRIPGAIVECGVWRGGSMMAVALTLIEAGDTDRELFLFDTFSGMSTPSDADRRAWDGRPAATLLGEQDRGDGDNLWCVAPIDDVRANMLSTDYPASRTRYVEGRVEETIPEDAPDQIAILRLDTDWYESTLHELRHLYDRIAPGGVLILDDYGEWEGARKATDEFLATVQPRPLLCRIDMGARIAVVPGLDAPKAEG